jgi:hypothetical protein
MRQQLWGYKVEEKLNLGVHEQKRLNTTVLYDAAYNIDIQTLRRNQLSLCSTTKIEAGHASETLVISEAIWCHIPEDLNHIYCTNLSSWCCFAFDENDFVNIVGSVI